MDDSGLTYVHSAPFVLESGSVLIDAQVRYNTYGHLNPDKTNVMFVCHALTGNSHIDSWWSDLLGPGKAFDTSKYLVVGANILGSCYGSTGPNSIDPVTKQRYGAKFPVVTIRDTVRLHIHMLQDGLGVKAVHCVVGGSFGGMQALEWALIGGDFVKTIAPIACGAAHTAWQIGISEAQRQAIYADPKWLGGSYSPENPPNDGLRFGWLSRATSFFDPFCVLLLHCVPFFFLTNISCLQRRSPNCDDHLPNSFRV
jgi:homoserine O-acetyltransferase